MKYIVKLCAEQRSHFEKMISSGHASVRVLARARILLLTDRSQGGRRIDDEVAKAIMMCTGSVLRIRKEFALHGLESTIYDKPRPGTAPKICSI